MNRKHLSAHMSIPTLRTIISTMRVGAKIALLLALIFGFSTVNAQDMSTSEEPLTITGSITQSTNSNPLQVPSGSAVLIPQGRASTADQLTVTSIGLNFNSTQGNQKFLVSANVIDNRYRNFDSLNYTATNFNAGWNWYLTQELTGVLDSKRSETLNSVADYSGAGLNRQVVSSTSLTANYILQGAWRALAELAQSKTVNDQPVLGINDFEATTASYGLQYAWASGSYVMVKMLSTNGSYLNLPPNDQNFTDSAYTESGTSAALHWVVSDTRAADFFITNLSRSHPTYSSRDYSGQNYGANFNWALTGKLTLTGGISRALAAFQTANTNYSVTDSISIGPNWAVSPKFSLSLTGQWDAVAYGGSPNAAVQSTRADNLNLLTITANWRIRRNWQMTGLIQNARRSSNMPGVAFDSSGASISVNFIF